MFDTVVALAGNLTASPDSKPVATGATLTTFRMAANSRYLDRATGEWKDSNSLFVSVVCWRGLADNVAASLTKGDRVLVLGRLRQRSWEVNGEKRSVLEVEADSVGPDLTRATVAVNRVRRTPPPDAPRESTGAFVGGEAGGDGGSAEAADPTAFGDTANAGGVDDVGAAFAPASREMSTPF
ncbi:MAG: single-stranded DNA-binding protein [Mycobacteriales bacterium]